MAFAASMEWDVRTTGDNSNGGGFDPVSGTPGTDYSQQDSPQITFTDLVIDGATNTKCTSAGNPFTSAHVGNVINITSGTGFTVQRVQIMSVTAGAATCDKSLGTLGSTGGNGKLGGGLQTLPLAATTLSVDNNTIHIKAGTYTLTSVLAMDNDNRGQKYIGYGSSHNDDGTKPLITTATNSTNLFSVEFGSVAHIYFRNISFSNTAGIRAKGIQNGYAQTGIALVVENCVFDGFTVALDRQPQQFDSIHVLKTEIKNCTTSGIRQNNRLYVIGCYIHDNAIGISSESGAPTMVAFTIFSTNPFGIFGTGGTDNGLILNNSFYNSNQHAVDLGGSYTTIVNNIFYGNARGLTVSSVAGADRGNAFGNNSTYNRTGTYFPPSAYAGDITLTADPFTNAAGGDFTLNNTAGGGAACKSAGIQWS